MTHSEQPRGSCGRPLSDLQLVFMRPQNGDTNRLNPTSARNWSVGVTDDEQTQIQTSTFGLFVCSSNIV